MGREPTQRRKPIAILRTNKNVRFEAFLDDEGKYVEETAHKVYKTKWNGVMSTIGRFKHYIARGQGRGTQDRLKEQSAIPNTTRKLNKNN
jgi:hypothetical protein